MGIAILVKFAKKNIDKETTIFMKILHISGAKGWGGNEQQIIYMIPHLKDLDVDNIVFGIKNSVLEGVCCVNNIKFVGTKTKKLNKFKNYWHLADIIKKNKPDIIHLHTSDSLMFFLFFNFIFKFKVKSIFSKKGMGASSTFLSKLKYNSNQLDSIICVSRMVRNFFAKSLSPKNRAKIVVVNDCVSLDVLNYSATVDIRKLYNIPRSKFIVGNIANHTNAKDLFTLIDVLYELKYSFNRDDIVFIQIGEYSKITDELKQYAIDRKVLKNIVFMGEVKKASSLNTQFDVFLLTSQREGGPTSLLEAMLLEVPVVSTNVGIVSDILIDGENGFVTDIKDSKSLAKKIQLLLDNKDLQAQFKQKGNKIIKDSLTAKSIAQKTFGEYQRVLSN